MNFKVFIISTALVIAPISINAAEMTGSNREVNGYNAVEMESALNDRGVVVEHVEQWGQLIRVDAVNEIGSRYVVMLDKDTLLPPGKEAASMASSQISGFKWLTTVDGAPESLSENENDDTASNG